MNGSSDALSSLTIGVDIGGTKIAAGIVDGSGKVLQRLTAPTPAHDICAIGKATSALVAALRASHDAPVIALGTAAAGFVAADHRTVSFAPNIAWRDHDLACELTALTGLPTMVENDANAAGWGEARFGAGCGASDLLVLTLGTGLGGAIICRDELIRGSQGAAAELGHLRVVPEGAACGCGQQGCWEQYASGTALTRRARSVAVNDPVAAQHILKLAGGAAQGIHGIHVTRAARAHDPLAIQLWEDLGTWLGAGVASMAAVLDPHLVVIGGGLAREADLFLPAARAELSRLLPASEHRQPPECVVAALGEDAGLIGVADLARQSLAIQNDPKIL